MLTVKQIILCGSGDDQSTPNVKCLISGSPCKQCLESQQDVVNGTNNSPNNRNETCLLITFDHVTAKSSSDKPADGVASTTNTVSDTASEDPFASNNNKPPAILVDCPLSFRACLAKSFFSKNYQFAPVCGYLACRSNSILGVDDIREVAAYGAITPLFASEFIVDELYRCFPYCMPGKKSAGQKALWTAGLNHQEKYIDENICFEIAGRGARRRGVSCLPLLCRMKEEEKEVKEAKKEENSSSKKKKEFGFAISLSDDGSFQEEKTPVALYLPFPELFSSEKEILSKISDIIVSQKFEVELAIVACPPTTINNTSDSSEKESCWKELQTKIGEFSRSILKAKKVVVCCLPHSVGYVGDDDDVASKKEGQEEQKEDASASSSSSSFDFVTMGKDTQIVYERNSSNSSSSSSDNKQEHDSDASAKL